MPTTHPEPFRLIIAEDMAAFRTIYAEIIQTRLSPEFLLVGQAVNGIELVQLTRKHSPHIILVDLMMPVMSGIDAIHKIRETDKKVKIVVLTTVRERSVIEVLLPFIDAYLFKEEEDFSNILEVIRFASVHGSPMFREYIRSVMKGTMPASDISFPEFELMLMVRKGKLNKEIAFMLSVSDKAIEKKLTLLYKKLGISGRKELEEAMEKRGLSFRG